jgi:hypothetical protein
MAAAHLFMHPGAKVLLIIPGSYLDRLSYLQTAKSWDLVACGADSNLAAVDRPFRSADQIIQQFPFSRANVLTAEGTSVL